MQGAQETEVLKEDVFGRVERLECTEPGGGGSRVLIRRVAAGSRVPGSRLVARLLLARERRALEALAGTPGIPRLEPIEGEVDTRAVLTRGFVAGQALHCCTQLPEDFFTHLEALVRSLHARGVCHNDLHKEQNIVVGADGFPHLIDFQLASVHAPGSAPESRTRDDLRHIWKHHRRYTRDGRGPFGKEESPGPRPHRTPLAWIWRRVGKPAYLLVTRGILRTRDGEERRLSSGPWPRWTPPKGPRPGFEA